MKTTSHVDVNKHVEANDHVDVNDHVDISDHVDTNDHVEVTGANNDSALTKQEKVQEGQLPGTLSEW